MQIPGLIRGTASNGLLSWEEKLNRNKCLFVLFGFAGRGVALSMLGFKVPFFSVLQENRAARLLRQGQDVRKLSDRGGVCAEKSMPKKYGRSPP